MLPCKSSSKSLFSACVVCFKTFTVTVKLKVQRFSTYSPPRHMLFSPWPPSPTTVEYLFQSNKPTLTHHILPKFIVYIRDPSCGCTFYESGQNYNDKETSLWYHRRVLLPEKSSVVCLFIASLLTLWTVIVKNLNCHTNVKKRKLNIHNLWPVAINQVTWQSLGNTWLTSSHTFCWNVGRQNFY